MTSRIAFTDYSRKSGRATISVALDVEDTLRALIYDGGTRAPGTFVETPYGWLYKHSDGEWGLPGLGYGEHPIAVRKTRGTTTTQMVATITVGKPPSTLGTDKITPQALLAVLWSVGFHTEIALLNALSIARGESGFYVKARNWLPGDGFRPAGTQIGVEGPAAAWNQNHTLQGHSDRGLWQFNSKAWPSVQDWQTDDPLEAARVVWVASKQGTEWKPWGFDEDEHHYDSFHAELQPFVSQFLATK